MDIKFSHVDDVQVVTIGGVIDDTEAAAVKFKLDEKINQGRLKVLLEVSRFNIADNIARHALLGIAEFSMTKGALTVITGVPAASWPLIILPSGKQILIFHSYDEGLTKLKNTVVPPPPPPPKKSEDDVKAQALKELLKTYEIYQQDTYLDPHRLEFHAANYRTNPTIEAVVAERRGSDLVTTSQEEIKVLEAECQKLSELVKGYMLLRKQPLSQKEIDAKKQILDNEIAVQKEAIKALETQRDTIAKAIQEGITKTTETSSKWEKEIKDLENQVTTLTAESEKTLAKLKEDDAKEEAAYQTKKAALSAAPKS